MPAPLPLTRSARARSRWPRRAIATLGAALAILAWHRGSAHGTSDCATAPADRVIEVCERAFLDASDPATGARLAEAHRLAGNHAVAGAIANGLLVTPVRADALWVLGAIALDEDRLDAAAHALANARALHRAAGDTAAAARDEQALRHAERLRACTNAP